LQANTWDLYRRTTPLAKHVELQRWNPLKLSGVGSLLDNAGWSLEVIRDVSTDYERWYRNFATRIHDLQPILVQEYGIETWEYAVKFYDTMYETVQSGNMGGAIVYAVKRG
jgi:hypothetical protein